MEEIKGALARLAVDHLPRILMVSHGIGGGVERHINELIELLDGRAHVLLLEPVAGRRELRLTLPVLSGGSPGLRLAYRWPKDAEVFWQLLNWLSFSRMHIHHVQGFPADFLAQLQNFGLEYDLTLHDHSIFTGHASLVNSRGVFDSDWLKQGLDYLPVGDKYLAQNLQRLALSAGRVIVPSAQLQQAIQHLLPDIAQSVCLLHRAHPDAECAEAYPQPYLRPLAKREPLRVLCLGMLSIEKGAGVLAQVAKQAYATGALIEFILLGGCHVPLPKAVERLGSYADTQVQELIRDIDPHLVWLPAQCPETWSYTLSVAFKAGLPVLTSAVGVFPERLQCRPLSWQCEHYADAQQWLDELLKIRGLHFAGLDAGFWSWQPPCAFYLKLPSGLLASEGLERAYWQLSGERQWVGEQPSLVEQSLRVAYKRANRGAAKWRMGLLAFLIWLRSSGWLVPFVHLIPYRWQQVVKRLITREPIAERRKPGKLK